MSKRHFSMNRMRGLSLVELLVAITLGAIILGGAVSLFVNNRDTYKTTNELSRLQETARYALDMVVKDIRMSGYFGCADRLDTVTDNTGAAAGDLWNPANPIEGWEGDVAANYLPSNVVGNGFGSVVDNVADNPGATDGDDGRVLALGGIVPDSITLRYLAGNMADLTGTAGVLDNRVTADALNGATSTITVDSATGYALNQVAAITDCGGSDVFQITAAPTATTVQANALSRGYNATSNPMIAPFVGVRYYIGANGRSPDPVNDPYPSLFRTVISPGGLAEAPQELFEGVESMQVLFGVDTDADGAPNSYVRAGDAPLNVAANWTNVVSVRLAIIVRTIDQVGREVDTSTYVLNDHDGVLRAQFNPVDDRRRRRVFTTTTMVRNL
jgi:type IV pilus assembly protein PilW